jgi:hypothetical protein
MRTREGINMKKWICSAALVLALGLVGNAWADCGGCDKGKAKQAKAGGSKTCTMGAANAKTCSKTCSKDGKSACDVPCMQYKVGDEMTCCPKTADKLANDNGGKMLFVVGEKEYQNKAEAMEAYAGLLEEHLEKVTHVRYAVGDKCVKCPKEAGKLAQGNGGKVKYVVGSATFDCKEKAEQAAQQAANASEKVKMTTYVDGKSYCCEKSAEMAAKRSGKKCEYQVGDAKTPCQTTARVELAKARIQAAVEAIQEQIGA